LGKSLRAKAFEQKPSVDGEAPKSPRRSGALSFSGFKFFIDKTLNLATLSVNETDVFFDDREA
jgi:hypothetical protein